MRHLLLVAAVTAGTAYGLWITKPAHAGGDYVYSDSMGNLIVESAAGYKRIVVGQGHMAKDLARTLESNNSSDNDNLDVVTLDGDRVIRSDCYRPGAWVKGRSYMYGRSEGDLPFLTECQ